MPHGAEKRQDTAQCLNCLTRSVRLAGIGKMDHGPYTHLLSSCQCWCQHPECIKEDADIGVTHKARVCPRWGNSSGLALQRQLNEVHRIHRLSSINSCVTSPSSPPSVIREMDSTWKRLDLLPTPLFPIQYDCGANVFIGPEPLFISPVKSCNDNVTVASGDTVDIEQIQDGPIQALRICSSFHSTLVPQSYLEENHQAAILIDSNLLVVDDNICNDIKTLVANNPAGVVCTVPSVDGLYNFTPSSFTIFLQIMQIEQNIMDPFVMMCLYLFVTIQSPNCCDVHIQCLCQGGIS
jgi:hypothetical protein